MSVLVEALSLIIPRKVLDVSYPGGTDTFMRKMCDPAVPCRLVCADDHLVSVSFHDAASAKVVGDELLGVGIVAVDDDCFQELAFVDQAEGPTLPCPWIEWRKHEDGYSYCWLAGTDPDPMHAPANWTPEQSRNLKFVDIRDEPGRCLSLADEDGRETLLDFKTGAVLTAPSRRPATGTPATPAATEDDATMPADSTRNDEGAPDPAGGLLIGAMRAVLDEGDRRYFMLSPETLTLSFRTDAVTYHVYCVARDKTDLVQITANYGSHVPHDRRVAIAEALARINDRIGLGNFELVFESGEIRFRIGMDVEDGILSGKMVENMLGSLCHCMESYHGALMRVAFGGVEPVVALAEVP